MKVSIIVPVYNTKKYLKRCLDSLINQSLEDIEIIIVNDGSTDDSQKVINKYHKKYPTKIVPIVKENGGPGIARNYGIKKAKGDYLGFVDSDDWVDPSMFKKLYKLATKGHDFIICDYVKIHKGNKSHVLKGFTGSFFDHQQAVLYSTDTAFSCNKLINKKLFDKDLLYTEGWYEDLATIPLLLTNAKSPAYLREPLYYYKFRSGSITNSNNLKTLGVIRSWGRLLARANPRYQQEIVFAVARNISSFLKFKPEHTTQFLSFAKEHQDTISKNIYYQEALRQGKLNDLFTLTNEK
ncbi:glycosyltransferase family 2 protein [Anaerobacillus sp. CMMVII]|uniref:glycosyltransferase family 2 protein n=1 Tax=Anaerobacillus sp. CMMVII TaxID=2755588 RepID=UPI0021B7A610|nr:glycosyltransferase family 2 protein [Anaerobacillus sp. CMMVII]MCT8137621.1 glycosyltransferase family 2 protein [Anaerobacillus sp. CMMVII]